MKKNYFITNASFKLLFAIMVTALLFNPSVKSWGQTTTYTENFTVSSIGTVSGVPGSTTGTSYYSTSFTTNAGIWQRVNVGYSSSAGTAGSPVAKFKTTVASSITSPALKGVTAINYSTLESAAVSNTLTVTDGGTLSNVFSYTSVLPASTVYNPPAPITPSATSTGVFTFAYGATAVATHYLDDIVFTFRTPTSQATAIAATAVTQTGMNLAWTRPNSGNDNQGCLVFVGPSATTFVPPTNSASFTANVSYGLGNQIGSTGYYCVYNGTGTSISLVGLAPGTSYSVYVLEYNGITGQSDENYNVTAPASLTQVTVASPTPIISLNPASLAFGYVKNNLTTTQIFNMSAGTLSPASGNITITAPAGFQVSTSSTTGFASTINIPYTNSVVVFTPIYVKFLPTVTQSYNGSISLSGGGATASETLTGSGTPYNVGSYKSVATANWGLATTWNKWDGAAWIVATDFPNATTADVYVLGGFNVNVDTSARSCANIYIDENSLLTSTNLVNTISYLKPYGTIVSVTPGSRLGNALTGNSADGLSLDIFSSNITITGGGAISLARMRTNIANTTVVIDTDITLNYHGSTNTGNAFSYYTVAGDNNTLTVNTGKTLTFAPWSCLAYNSSGHSIASNLSQTINLYGTMTFVDGDSSGVLVSNGWVGHTNNYFSMNVNNTATSTLNVYNGGVLNVSEFYPNGTNAANTPGVGNPVTINVATGGKINVSKIADFRNTAQTVTGGGEFNLLAGATLKIGSTTGISASAASGPIQTSTRGFNAGATYSYEGIASQVTGNGLPSNVSGLAVSNATGVTLTASATVNGSLSFTAGNLITGSNSLTLGTAATITGAGTGWVVGPLSKQTASNASPSFNYAIGDATNYTPIALVFTANNTATTTGTITASATSGDHPQVASSGIDNANSVNRTWSLANNGVTGFTDYSATLNYAALDNDATAVPANYVVRKYNASAWTAPLTTATPSATSAAASGLVDFGDFAVGTSSGVATVALQPLASTICGGSNTTFSAAIASSTLLTTTKWQRSTDGSVWTDITANLDAGTVYGNFTTGTLTLTGSAAGLNNYQYRAVFTSINGSTTSSAVALTVNTTAAPTASAQSFCNSGTVAGLTATGTGLNWYATSTSATALASTTALATGNYYVSQTLNSCEGPRATVAVTVNTTAAPAASAQSFCNSGTVAGLTATGTGLNWYATSTSATALASTAALATGNYYVSQTLNSCEGPRTTVAVTVNTTAAPTASAQSFCNSGTVAGLTATGTGLNWYATSTSATALASTTALATGTYYVSQTLNSCQGPRASVAVTVNTTAAPTGAATQSLSSLLTVGSIVVTGTNVVWYSSSANAAAGTNPLPNTTVLSNATYYATQTVGGCTSATSLAVTITTLGNQDFDMTAFSYYPNPVNAILNLSYSQALTNVKVFNMLGQQLLAKEVNANTTQIDLSSFANGAYFIQVATESATKTVRVIKR